MALRCRIIAYKGLVIYVSNFSSAGELAIADGVVKASRTTKPAIWGKHDEVIC